MLHLATTTAPDCVPQATLQMMVVALLYSRLDYGNGVLVGLPVYLMRQLQSVLNAAARLIFRLKTSDHITDALVSLHWLRAPERIQYKLAVMAFKVLQGRAPSYLGRATRPRRRCVWSSSTPLCRHEPYLGAACHVYYRWQSSLLSRCPTNLELSSR